MFHNPCFDDIKGLETLVYLFYCSGKGIYPLFCEVTEQVYY